MKILYRETQGDDRKHPVTGVAKDHFPAVLKTFYDEFVTKKNAQGDDEHEEADLVAKLKVEALTKKIIKKIFGCSKKDSNRNKIQDVHSKFIPILANFTFVVLGWPKLSSVSC